MHRFEACGEFINKTEPGDYLSFINHSLASLRSIDMVSGGAYHRLLLPPLVAERTLVLVQSHLLVHGSCLIYFHHMI